MTAARRLTHLEHRTHVTHTPAPQRTRVAPAVGAGDQYELLGREQIIPGVGRAWKPLWADATCAKVNIPEVRPSLSGGRFAIKRVLGEELTISADVIKDGHDVLGAELLYRKKGETRWQTLPMEYSYEEDEFSAKLPLNQLGALEYTVCAWTDRFDSWREELRRKSEDGQDVSSVLLEGAELVRAAAGGASGEIKARLLNTADRLTVETALSSEVRELVRAHQKRDDLSMHGATYRVAVEPERAQFGSWYELFPRSCSPVPGRHGTLRDAMAQLPSIKEKGFDVVYLPPIHPIGEVNRKGKNNALSAGPKDVGSPWAIGSKHGGHDAIHPELGTFDDFDAFVKRAGELGIDVAIDLAVQCAPDHPYAKNHPEWFRRRPDGTIKYAENPPKKYQDIVQLDMWGKEAPAMWNELKRVVLGWIERGVKIFRVDNPHTKPAAFWEWLISGVKEQHPEVIFLAEAFTRPKKMQHLAKIGFSQSYTYFTWKNTRAELEDFMRETLETEQAEYLRPNFFANTPDILSEYLQEGGIPAFKTRFALAGTLAGACGIYSGYELGENVAVRAGSEEYLDSEKYELRQRSQDTGAENISGYIREINQIRRQNAALRGRAEYAVHDPDDENFFSFSKVSSDGANKILVIANLDPHEARETMLRLNGAALGLEEGSSYRVRDLITGEVHDWSGLTNYVRLDPSVQPVHIFRVETAGTEA